ncbi:MAG: hypothetical protein HYX92_08605 [Chloroflexi bacterium]|nr:hypothetical protein [Chloroflexota bacterium]
MAQVAARALGYPDLNMVVLPHPFETKTVEEARAIADAKVDEVVQKLTQASPVPAAG